MPALNPKLAELCDDDRQVLESWLVEFDRVWDENVLANRLEQIPPGSSWRLPALSEMVKIDLQRQWQRGRQVSLESYLEQYPELGSPGDVSADLIQAEYEVRRQFGAPVSLDDYVRRFPHQAGELASLLAPGSLASSRHSSAAEPSSPRFQRSANTPEPLPEQLGRYKIIKRLGQGGMGSVYLAQDTHLQRSVALKVPDFGSHEDPEARRRFLEEARTAATLDHPYLCPVHDAGEIDGQLYLTMAYIEGQSLAVLIGDAGWPQRQVAALVGKLALALQEAHTRKVVHRDLKPANVMIKTTGQRREPVIVDFGLARRENPQEHRLTKSGQIMGTLGYMAPEQIRGDLKEIGPASDIYALGVILYELLTGRLPFSGSGLAIAGQILTQAPLPPSAHRTDLDPVLEVICLKAMAKTIGDRYASMSALAAALTDFLQSSATIQTPTVASTSPASPSPASDERPQPTGSSSLVGQFLNQLAGTQASPAPITTPEPAVSRTPLPERRRSSRPMIVAASVLGVILLFVIIYVVTDKGRIKITVAGPALSIKVDRDVVRIEGLDEPITLRSGEHELTVIRGKTETETRKFIVRRGNNEEVRLEYEPAAGDRAKADRHPAPSAESASGRTDASPVRTPPEQTSAPPVSTSSKPAEKMPLPPTPLVYVDEFNGPRDLFPRDPNTSRAPPHGRADGVYFVDAPGESFWGWNIHGIPSDGSCEVVARVLSKDPRNTAAWLVYVGTKFGEGSRGFLIKIDVKGELFLEPSPWRKAAAFRQIDPRMGPIRHPAIRPGNVFNKLLLIMKKREIVIFVNGVQVCDPVRFEYNVTPSGIGFGASGQGMKRAEFDRLEIREIMQPEDAHVKAEAIPAVKPASLLKPQPTVPEEPPKLITNSLGMKLVLIPAGEFLMGSPDSDKDAKDDEKPQHRVRITRPFYLGATEVTVGQFRRFVKETGYRTGAETDGKGGLGWNEEANKWVQSSRYTWQNPGFEQTDEHPVVNVSWNDAVGFAQWLTRKEKNSYRLPTEAEWEYACRAGTVTRFSNGDNAEGLAAIGNVKDGTAKEKHPNWATTIAARDGYVYSAPVGRFQPNEFGLYDMHGNAAEWCSDGYAADYYKQSPGEDPPGASEASRRVVRGGGFYNMPLNCRSAFRLHPPGGRNHHIGVRLALVPSGP